MADLVGAIDQGTTSTRFLVVDSGGREVGRHQVEHRQHLPRTGWVEHDAAEIWDRTCEAVTGAMTSLGLQAGDLRAIGLTNQRETTVVWDPTTGEPLHHAIVWQDTRTDRIAAALRADGRGEVIRERTGLPPSTYFAAGKMQWLLENVDGLRHRASEGTAVFGTIDSWLLWNLTGGTDGGVHVTDVTNAGRTMLMDLRTLAWDDELLAMFDIPRRSLATIAPSSCPTSYGSTRIDGPFGGEVPITGVLGDQHAATVGQTCFAPGEVKNTYGTGNFLLLNTGTEPVVSDHGLLTTVAYQFHEQPAVYALEGSIAVTGSAVQWLRDQLGIIETAAQIEELASRVEDSADLYFVPAFSGLFAPHWRSDARGAIVGMSRFHTRDHLARAALEAICWQSRDVVDAMQLDSGAPLTELRVDGGVTANDLCLQIQADILGVPVIRPAMAETTALGAAYAAGLAVEVWSGTDELRQHNRADTRFEPQWDDTRRAHGHRRWQRAVQRTLNWVVDDDHDAADPAEGSESA